MEIVEKPIGEVRQYPGNGRINKETVKVLKALIQKVGFNVPIVVDKQGVIVKGHARHKAATELGFETIPCIVSENSDEVNNKDRILDNKISELSHWDVEKLQYEIESVQVELQEVGLKFDMLRPELAEINAEDINKAKAGQGYDADEDDSGAFLAVECPKCGGHFEYKAKTY